MSQGGETIYHCPSCDVAIEVVVGQDLIVCGVCRSEFSLAGHLCPNCGHFHEAESGVCAECGSAMIRLCRNCHSTNWTGFDVCVVCGDTTGLASTVVARSTETTAGRLNKQMENARQLRLSEEASSDKRMAELMAIEETRQAEIRKRINKQKEQEKRLLLVVFGAVALFLIVLVIYAIASSFT